MSTHIEYRLAHVVLVGDPASFAEVTVSAFEVDEQGRQSPGCWSDSVLVECRAGHEHGAACGRVVLSQAAQRLDALREAAVAARAPRRLVQVPVEDELVERRRVVGGTK